MLGMAAAKAYASTAMAKKREVSGYMAAALGKLGIITIRV